jgi:low temperature requirement protein LtrA
MDLISVILESSRSAFILWLVNTLIPMDGRVKQILNAVVVIALVLWLLSLFIGMPSIRVGR